MPSLSKALTIAMADTVEQVAAAIDVLLPRSSMAEAKLYEAMRYGCLGAGKRLRPFLVMESARLFGVNPACALRVAAAVEFIHCYSLIHDDLPALDDASERRGRPTVHRQFDEATAILAGDALLTAAFEVLTDPETHEDARIRCALVAALAKAAGPRGMVGGQMLDLVADSLPLDIGAITRLQRLKTGELIAFAVTSGALLGRAAPPQLHALQAYAHDLGLAFQIADDLSDVEAREMHSGKAVGRKRPANRATFVTIMGVDRARDQALRLAEQAQRHLDIFEGRAGMLAEVASYVVERPD